MALGRGSAAPGHRRRLLGVDDFAIHRLPLTEAPPPYERFQKKHAP